MQRMEFFQDEVLRMTWLSRLLRLALENLGLDVDSRIGGSLHFFLYDCVKITIYLCVLIFAISYVQSFFPPERTKKILGHFRGLSANLVAALLGTVTPFCSCSSIPIFMGFTAAGIPLGVSFSFLISSPMVDLGSLVLLTGIFGLRIASVYVILGLMLAVLGGLVIEHLSLENEIEPILLQLKPVEQALPTLSRKERLSYAAEQVKTTFRKVFPYILLGVGIGSLIHNWIPENWIISLLGKGNPAGVILATLVGIPMYADIFGTIPIAESLLLKGAELGTVLAFMMGVTTLSLPSMIMLRKVIKPKLLGAFIGICILGIILIGYIFNALQSVRLP